jgi:tetratricopeptide (TPR) repeat protein
LATEALDLRRQRLANRPVEVWNSLINLGQMRVSAGDLTGAEQARREAFELAQKLFDEKNRKVIQSMNGLARTLWLKRDARSLEEAHSLQSRAVELAHAIDGDKSLELAQGTDLLGCIARDRGDLPRAIELFRDVLRMRTEIQKVDHPQTAGAMAQLADSLTRAGQPSEAIELATRELEIRRAKLQPGDWALGHTASILGGALTAAGQFDKAEPLLLEAQQTLKSSAVLGGRPRREATERLVTLYEKWGRPDDAGKWRGELGRLSGVSTLPAAP